MAINVKETTGRELLDTKEIAGRLRYSRKTVERLCRSKKIPYVFQIGKDWRMRSEDYERWLEELANRSRPGDKQ